MKLVIKPSARTDIQNQRQWYLEQGVPRIADRFRMSVWDGFNGIMRLPLAGALRRYNNPHVEGMRVWPIKGFKEMRIYYLVRSNTITIVRILHDKRDAVGIFEDE